jgi:hypothetical protein
MQTLTIQRYGDLNQAQWRRVIRTAKRRVRQLTGQDCEIGLGRKYRGGRPCGWQIALRVYLPRKRTRVTPAKRIPNPFQIRLRGRDGRYVLLRIRSDVESLADFVPTCGRVRLGRRQAAAGFVLQWFDHQDRRQWGLATVAHLFDTTRRRLVSVRLDASTRFRCRLLADAPPRSGLDLAILQIIDPPPQHVAETLLERGVIERDPPAAVRLMPTRQVHRAALGHRRGRTFFPAGSAAFVGEEVFPDGFRLGKRRVDDCIRVVGAEPGAFSEGTSGAYWRFGRTPACLQLGGRAGRFREGIGQPFHRCRDWIREQLGRRARVVAVLDE